MYVCVLLVLTYVLVVYLYCFQKTSLKKLCFSIHIHIHIYIHIHIGSDLSWLFISVVFKKSLSRSYVSQYIYIHIHIHTHTYTHTYTYTYTHAHTHTHPGFVDSFYSPGVIFACGYFPFCALRVLHVTILYCVMNLFLFALLCMLTSSGWALRRLGTMQVSTYRIEGVLSLSLWLSLSFSRSSSASLCSYPLMDRVFSLSHCCSYMLF